MDTTDTHVSANNPFISHEGPRDICQFRDCIGRRVRYTVFTETNAPSADVARVQRWLDTATELELHIARLVVDERGQFWVKALLETK